MYIQYERGDKLYVLVSAFVDVMSVITKINRFIRGLVVRANAVQPSMNKEKRKRNEILHNKKEYQTKRWLVRLVCIFIYIHNVISS